MPTPKPTPAPIPDTALEATPTVPQPDGTPAAQVGAPEGVEPGSSGALAETTATPSPATPPTLPLAADLHVDNSTETLVTPSDPVAALADHLARSHPGQALEGEHPATTAVRILTAFGTHGTAMGRCGEAYCNRPALHTGEHGWVHVER